MAPNDSDAYWAPIFEIARQHKVWSRTRARLEGSMELSDWGQLHLIPVPGWLETSMGPVPTRDVEWLALGTSLPRLNVYENALTAVHIDGSLLGALAGTAAVFEARMSTWSHDRFGSMPMNTLRIANPFFLP